MEQVKITSLELENVKRIRAITIQPTENGLTVIGGKNRQGKTSVLDGIAWALGGDRYRPSMAAREGSAIPPHLKVTLSNGIVVERAGKNSDLKVTDPIGRKAGQQLLNSFVEQLALDLPKFMEASSREKANTLLQIIGVGDRLFALDKRAQEIYSNRHAIGQVADQKKKYAAEMPSYPEAPKELVSASELIRQQQDILAQNGENQRKRMRADQLAGQVTQMQTTVTHLQKQLEEATKQLDAAAKDLSIARTDALDLVDQSTEELEKNIQEIDDINRKVRANLDKAKAEDDANELRRQYEKLTAQLTSVREERMGLLEGAILPLPGLSVSEDGDLTYKGQKWDNLSGADQLIVSTSIVRALKPQCGFVLLDKLEQMDTDTLAEFGAWMADQNLQGIATRVSTGGECSIIIEDGYATSTEPVTAAPAKWEKGVF